MDKTRIALVGAHGRMGTAIQGLKAENEECEIVVTLGRSNLESIFEKLDAVDVILDVAVPAATESLFRGLLERKAKKPYVVGCTGWTDAQLLLQKEYAALAPLVVSPNFSPGVNLFLELIGVAAPTLAEWGYDVVINEVHHKRKLDRPSGTAKAMIERLGNAKTEMHSTRAGNIVGTHEIQFIGPNDILTFSHEALDRVIFARGAWLAARWAAKQTKPALYSMRDVLF